jgi:mutual gliding-motility protein MglA
MRINSATNEVIIKIVYYGPGMAGKTTNLTVIHDRVPSQSAGDLVMVDTHSERTLRFDLLGFDAGEINGHRVHFEFFTVPGQSYYAATRRAVLAGADAIVFVADSRREALDENIEAMNEMLGNLRHHGLSDDLPVILQYNKQDLPTALKREQLEPLMNVRGWPSIPSVAVDGNGVMETMQLITHAVLERVRASNQVPAATLPAPTSWLISCFRCQAMLEVPDAHPGTIYACGICGSALEVVDGERGITRAPAPTAVTAAGTAGSGGQPTIGSGAQRQVGSGGQRQVGSGGQRKVGSGGQRSVAEDSAYGMQALSDRSPAYGQSAVTSAQANSQGQAVSTPFEVAGYDVLAELDESVQGRRLRVRERSTGRTLRALVLHPGLIRQPGYAESLDPHIRLAGQVKHPYILPLVAMTPTAESRVLFSADPPDYEPLVHVLARRRALAPPHAMGILRQVVLALEEAARHGVVHGWLRPEVILVSPDGNVLVDEFGVAKNHRYLVRELSGASAATEYYLAPELLSGDARSDVRTDIFMLGALLFRMMTGEGLVTGYNAHEALHKVVANGARTLRSIQSGVSRDLDQFCQRLVAAERKDRLQNYREVLDVLDKFGGGAKRQTLRLTGNVAASQAQTQHAGTSQLRRGGTGPIRRADSGGHGVHGGNTAQHRRTTAGSGERLATRPRQPATSNTGMIVLVAVMIVMVAVVAYILIGHQPKRATQTPETLSNNSSASANPYGKTERVTPPPSATTPTKPAATPSASGTEKAAQNTHNNATPSWIAKTQPTNAPSTPEPGSETAGSTSQQPNAAPNVIKEEDRLTLILAIAELERGGRYKEAMAKCEQLPSADERQARLTQIAQNYENKRKEVALAVTMASDLAQVEILLKPALQNWGLPGDVAWAEQQLASAKERLANKPVTKKAGTQDKVATEKIIIQQALVDKAIVADLQINQALATGQLSLAQQGLSTLDENTPEAAALKRKIELYQQRGEILARIIQERHPKLRVLPPTSQDQWDVVGVIETGLVVASAGGSKTELTWSQVSLKDTARIFLESAAHPMTKADEFATATIMQLIAGDLVMASVTYKRGKSSMDQQLAKDVEVLIYLARQREVLELAAVGKTAAASGNTKLLQDTIEQIKKLDPAMQALVANDLAALEQAKTTTPVSGAAADSSKDRILFEQNDDLKIFSEKSGTWIIANGMAGNSSFPARLIRKDLDDARAAQLMFMPMSNKGQMSVEFRGVRFVIDFLSSSYQCISREQTNSAKKFAFLPKTVCSLYFELRQPGNLVNVLINNGATSDAIKAGDALSSVFAIQSDSANIAVDELQILRGRPAASKEKQDELRKLGLEPMGEATLEAPAIVLPLARGQTSGVAITKRDNIAGLTVDVKGDGMLRIQAGNPNDRSGLCSAYAVQSHYFQ